MKNKKPIIGISSCLLGQNVRYNGGNTIDKWITNKLKDHVEFYPLCPEVEMGLGTPRNEIQLYHKDHHSEYFLRDKKTNKDLTKNANRTYDRLTNESLKRNLNGFILMKKSPSCGLGVVKNVNENDVSKVKLTNGLFAQHLINTFPNTPIIDSGRIFNDELKEQFIKNVFAHFRFQNIDKKVSALQAFHQSYKYILMEHSQLRLRQLGTIASNRNKEDIHQVFIEYQTLFMKTLNEKASKENRYNTLLHLLGYFKKELSKVEKQEILKVLKDYKEGIENYNVPLNLLNFFIKKFNEEYLSKQYIFSPYPKSLKLHLAI